MIFQSEDVTFISVVCLKGLYALFVLGISASRIPFRSRRKSMSAIRWAISRLIANELYQLSSWRHDSPESQEVRRKE
ncbi:hypothetical protein Tco_0537883 [Tanacetum coccineum]